MTTAEIARIAALSHAGDTLAAQEGLTPAAFLDQAAQRELYQDAIQFLAHKMAARTAIQWAHDCVRDLRAPEQAPAQEKSLSAVETWLQLPNDAARWGAKDAAEAAGISSPADCVAMAVFLSDGSMAPPSAPHTPPPAHADRKMAAAGVILAVLSHTPEHAADRYRKALAMGRQLDV